jgi:hypothetical protein
MVLVWFVVSQNLIPFRNPAQAFGTQAGIGINGRVVQRPIARHALRHLVSVGLGLETVEDHGVNSFPVCLLNPAAIFTA